MSTKRIFSLFLILNFFLIGCSSLEKKSVATQRAIETREYNVDAKTLIRASIGTFQDLGYTIDTINEEFGLITASKVKPAQVKKTNGFQKGMNVMRGLFSVLALAVGEWEEAVSTEYHEDEIIPEQIFTATITVKAIDDQLSSLRANFEAGKKKKYSSKFFKEFFIAIDKSLFLETETE